jgi:succinoglycan biosynthesis transport protein ExoP
MIVSAVGGHPPVRLLIDRCFSTGALNGTENKIMELQELTLSDYADILKRRKWSFILPAALVFATAVLIAMLLPPIFQSTATILIEEQEIPQDFVRTTVTSFAEQRIQVIKQKILSSAVLGDIIRQLDLYEEEGQETSTTNEVLIDNMRQNITVLPVSADVINQRTGKAMMATISFSVSFEGKDPVKVQKVTDVLTTLFLKENLRVREAQVLETAKFLKDEMAKLKTELDEYEIVISQFKEKHITELPSLLNVNLQSLNNIERRIDPLNAQLNSLKDRLEYIENELYQTPPRLEIPTQKQLASLKNDLMQLKMKFSDEYPDVIKTKAAIADLERQLEETAKSNPEGERPDNPAYLRLAAQRASINIEINSILTQIEDLKAEAAEYRKRIEATPKAEERLRTLASEREKKQVKYDDLARKLMESEVSYGLEKEQKGERFTLLNPANFPIAPIKPNRKVIVLLGLILGVGAGLGLVSIREYSDHSVHNAGSLARLTSVPVLASIPEIVTRKEKSQKKKKVFLLMLCLIALLAGTLFTVHHYFVDFPTLWGEIAQNLAL